MYKVKSKTEQQNSTFPYITELLSQEHTFIENKIYGAKLKGHKYIKWEARRVALLNEWERLDKLDEGLK